MHGPSSLLALLACLSLTSAAPAIDRRAVVTVTKYVKNYKAAKPTPAPAPAPLAAPIPVINNAQVFKEAAIDAPPAVEEKKPAATPPSLLAPILPAPTTTTASKEMPTQEAPKPTVKPGGGAGSGNPNLLTIQVTNAMNVAIQTVPGVNQEAYGILGTKFPGPGSIQPGKEGEMVVPKGWAGRIAVLKEGQSMAGVESLIEASFEDNGIAMDVSFVDGFTVPIVCSCGGKRLSGCNRDLLKESKCPSLVGEACKNPNRGTKTPMYDPGAHPFFEACRGAAYTWDTDDLATDHSTCKGVMSCCVGTDCPNLDQKIKFPYGISQGVVAAVL